MSEFREQTPQLQRPEMQRADLGIESVQASGYMDITQDQYPWMKDEAMRVPTVLVKMQGLEQPVRYGSFVDGNSTLEKLASEVSLEHSKRAERCMFQAIPSLVEKRSAPTIESIDTTSTELSFKTALNGHDAPRLFFSFSHDKDGTPTILKFAVTSHKKQQQALGILAGQKFRRKKGEARR